MLGERREYLTIKILHNDMTVRVPTENAALVRSFGINVPKTLDGVSFF